MVNLKDCFYVYNCNGDLYLDNQNNDNDNDNDKKIEYIKYPITDLRVFEKDYCDISYADGYILQSEEEGIKGKVKYFISNGIGDWREKIEKIKTKLGNYDVAYFTVPEIQSIIVITKTADMPIITASRVLAQANEIAKTEATKTIKIAVDEIVNKKLSSATIDISFVATNQNKIFELQKLNFGNNNFTTYKIPDELKCGDYEVKVELQNTGE